MSNPTQIVELRLAAINEEIASLKTRIATLENEKPELQVALRVLSRLAGEARREESEDQLVVAEEAGGAKPEGIPTVPEMIVRVLREAKLHGRRGLEPKEIQAEIARLWWPGVKADAIGPTAWRMRKRGDLSKQGDLYVISDAAEARRDRAAAFLKDLGLESAPDAQASPETNKASDVGASEASEVPVPQSTVGRGVFD
jgi:hypothetical protein